MNGLIKVLLFAQVKEQLGNSEMQVSFSGGTVKEFKEYMVTNYPLHSLDNMMIAVNEEFAEETALINEGDVVAIIPPVSGG